MKSFITLALFLGASFYSEIVAQNNYKIELNDTTIEVTLGNSYQLKLGDELVTLSLSLKDTLDYFDEMYRFKYPKDYNVSQIEVDEGIEQIMVMTAAGSGYMIQKYTTIDPSFLTEMMLSELTKESVSYGYKLERQDYTRTMLYGEDVEVSKAVLSYKDEINVYEITSIGLKDEGFLIVTMDMGLNINSDGLELIQLLWDSFQVNTTK